MAAQFLIMGGMMAAGSALNIYGNIQANKKQAIAERENAKYLEEQAAFTREAERQALNIFQDESEQFLGSQISGYSRGGVALGGSALAVFADTISKQLAEKESIKLDYQSKEREALLKAGASYRQAEYLSNWKTNFLQSSSTGLGAGSAILDRAPKQQGGA